MALYGTRCGESGLSSGNGNVNATPVNEDTVYHSPTVFIPPTTPYSPYNPDDVGIIPLPKNEATSDAEILQQTDGMWEKLGKISGALLSSFPGSLPYMFNPALIPTTYLIPDVNPEYKPPSKSGGSGIVPPPPEAKSPPITPPPDPKLDPKWDENDPFAWWKTLLGIKPSPYSFAPPDAPPSPPPDDKDTFWDNFKTSRTPFGDVLDHFTGEKEGFSWQTIAFIGAGALLIIVLIK